MRLRLDLGYDGAQFRGWAPQPGGLRTVAGVLSPALAALFGADCVQSLTVAGRTDAGVHATGQVAHVDVPAPLWSARQGTVLVRLAGLLPPDVRVYQVTEVPLSFDARFSALSRRYAYRVSDAVWGAPPLRRHDTLAWPHPLEITRLNQASRALVGEHDFAAFCRRKPFGTTRREVTELHWHRDADGIVVATVAADAFCQAMVRGLVGALLPVGDGRRPVTWPAELLTRTERANEITVAPAHGLTLIGVTYPADPAEYASRAAVTRNVRAPSA